MQVSKDDERRRNDRLAKKFMLQSKAHVLLPDACSVLTKHEGVHSSHGMAERDKWEAAETKDVFCLKKLDVCERLGRVTFRIPRSRCGQQQGHEFVAWLTPAASVSYNGQPFKSVRHWLADVCGKRVGCLD